jgi:hypothetical protein
MAKDPRFNFYVDNWIGGTEGFTLEQEGAYLSLIVMQSKIGRFTADQALDKLLQKTRGNTAVSTGLWIFLIPKFSTDGILFWSERLEKEMSKSKIHSEKQSERIKQRWNKQKAESGNTAVLPVNSIGSGIGNSTKYNNGEFFKNPEEAFTEVRDDEELVNSLVRIARGSGYLTTTDIHVMTAVKRFFVLEGAKPDFTRRPRDEIKKHLINWMGKNAKTIQNGQ